MLEVLIRIFYICRWDYDYLTSTYFLLLERKQRGQVVRLSPGNNSPHTATLNQRTPKPNLLIENQVMNGAVNEKTNLVNIDLSSPITPSSKTYCHYGLADSPRGLHNSLEGGLDDLDLLKVGQSSVMSPGAKNIGPADRDFDRTRNRASERYPVPHKKSHKVENQQQSQIAYDKSEDKENEQPAQLANYGLQSQKGVVKGQGPANGVKGTNGMSNSPLSPSRSLDSGLNQPTPIYKHKHLNIPREGSDWVFATPEKPTPISKSGSISNRKVLGSIERGLGN